MLKLLCTTILLSIYISKAKAYNVAGYHYEKPTSSLNLNEGSANLGHGHSFGPLPTVQPLPPVPALPPLPTAPPKGQFMQTQTIYQTHPEASSVGKIAQQYQPTGVRLPLQAQQSTTSSIKSEPTGTGFSLGQTPNTGLGAPLAPQPLRVPFGKQAIISFPSGTSADNGFGLHARQLHQYAVIEIIDNDIEQNTQPFLNKPFFDTYRAHVGATGMDGTPAPLLSRLLGSKSNDALFGSPLPQAPASDAVALGSGGLGFIRLANGNVYLGSGSLGYVSGQQHTQEINEARTRTGASQPDALHFGHGPLGNPNRLNKFSYRFK